MSCRKILLRRSNKGEIGTNMPQ